MLCLVPLAAWLPFLHAELIPVLRRPVCKVLDGSLLVLEVMAPVIITAPVHIFIKCPCNIGRGCARIVAQRIAPVVGKDHGLQNFIAFIAFYLGFLLSGLGPTWPEVLIVTKYPHKPGQKVLGYSGPENRGKIP